MKGHIRRTLIKATRAHVQFLVVGGSHADKHPGAAAGQTAWAVTGIFDARPHGLDKQSLLWVHAFGLHRGDAEEQRIESIHVGHEAAAVHSGVKALGVRIAVALAPVPTVRGHLADHVVIGLHVLPEFARICAAGKPPAQTNDRDRLAALGLPGRRTRNRCDLHGSLAHAHDLCGRLGIALALERRRVSSWQLLLILATSFLPIVLQAPAEYVCIVSDKVLAQQLEGRPLEEDRRHQLKLVLSIQMIGELRQTDGVQPIPGQLGLRIDCGGIELQQTSGAADEFLDHSLQQICVSTGRGPFEHGDCRTTIVSMHQRSSGFLRHARPGLAGFVSTLIGARTQRERPAKLRQVSLHHQHAGLPVVQGRCQGMKTGSGVQRNQSRNGLQHLQN